MVAAGLATAVVYRRRRRGLQGAAVTAAPLVVVAVVAAFTFDPAALEQPQFTGLLSRAPYLAGEGRAVVDRLESYRSGVADMVRSVTTLYTATDELPVLDRGGEVTTVLHLSDIHLNPQGLDLAEQLVDQFGVDVVVDTGDVTTWGSDAESATLARIGGLERAVRVRARQPRLAGHRGGGGGAAERHRARRHDGRGGRAGLRRRRRRPLQPGRGGLEEGDGGEEAVDDAKREAARGSAEELADLVGVTDRAGDDVDVALIHDPSALDALFGKVPLVLAGHYHRRIVRLDESGTRVMVQGSSGGAGFSAGALESLEQGEPLPLSASLLYFAASGDREGQLVAYDEVTVGGLGLSSVSIDRVVVLRTRTDLDRPDPETEPGAAPDERSVTPRPLTRRPVRGNVATKFPDSHTSAPPLRRSVRGVARAHRVADASGRESTPEEEEAVVGDSSAAAPEWAQDGELADEIVLYSEVMVAASESDDDLTQNEIDTALGLDDPSQV